MSIFMISLKKDSGIQINHKGGKVIQIDVGQLSRLFSYQQDSSYKGRSR